MQANTYQRSPGICHATQSTNERITESTIWATEIPSNKATTGCTDGKAGSGRSILETANRKGCRYLISDLGGRARPSG